ncbi:MAG: MFS transporter [Gammaproteobacteria bacterium]|nr:MFS transporter [Gammaproteobacteria bacterium]
MKLPPGTVAIGFSNVGHLLTHMFMLLYPTAVLGIEREFNVPYGELLSLSLAGFVLFGLGALPAGWLADRWSERGMMAANFIGMGGAAILTGFAPNLFWLSCGLGAIGLFASIYHPVGIAIVVRHAKARGRALGINGVFGGIGLASGALVAGTLTELISWRAAFIIPGAIAVLFGGLFLLVARRVGLENTREDAYPQQEVTGRVMASTFLTLTLATVFTGLMFQATSIALPKVFAERLSMFSDGTAIMGAGGVVTLVYLGAACFQIIGGLLADRYPLKWVYTCAYCVQVPLLVVAATLADLPLVFVVMLMVLFQNGAGPAETALFARYSPARWRATAFGIKFVIALGVSALAVPLVAFIFDRTGGFYWLFVVMAGLAALTTLIGARLPHEPRTPAHHVPVAQGAGG